MKTQKVLVTGASGFVGANLVRRLTSKFFDWKPVYNIDEGLKKTISSFRNNLSFI